MYISGAKFEDYCSNISRDILDSVFSNFSSTVYYAITFLICIKQKRHWIPLEPIIFQKKENAILLYFLKTFK